VSAVSNNRPPPVQTQQLKYEMFHEVSKEMNPPNAKVNNTWSMMNISKHKN
jgi:hypothetical protein